jgi:protein TonB
MASPEEVTPLVPETLPEDFGDWDSEDFANPAPTNPREAEAASARSNAAKPGARADDRDAILASLMERPRVSRPGSAFVKQPNDFTSWEKEATSAPAPAKSSEWDTSKLRREIPKPLAKSPERASASSPVVEKPRETWPALSSPVFAKPQKLTGEPADGSTKQASPKPEAGLTPSEAPVAPSRPGAAKADVARGSHELSTSEMRKADEALYQFFSSKNTEVTGEQKPAKKKWMIFVAAGACAILIPVAVVVSMGHHGVKTVAKQPSQSVQGATDTELQTNGSKPPANGQVTQGKPSPSNNRQEKTDDQSAQEQNATNQAQALTDTQTRMMNDQLSAPRTITPEMRKQTAENAPPPASLGAEGLGGGAMANVFNGHGQPTVKASLSKPLLISSAVANSMLVQKTAPAYPPMAKAALVSGTVELRATISKDGRVQDLHVVNGPAMLRQAAVDAVRNWRYKPYLLNDEPTEVETTIVVAFTLGK